MKKILLAGLLVLAMTIAGCGNSDDTTDDNNSTTGNNGTTGGNNNNNGNNGTTGSSAISGTYIDAFNSNIKLVFKSDGSYTQMIGQYTITGTYTVSDSYLNLSGAGAYFIKNSNTIWSVSPSSIVDTLWIKDNDNSVYSVSGTYRSSSYVNRTTSLFFDGNGSCTLKTAVGSIAGTYTISGRTIKVTIPGLSSFFTDFIIVDSDIICDMSDKILWTNVD